MERSQRRDARLDEDALFRAYIGSEQAADSRLHEGAPSMMLRVRRGWGFSFASLFLGPAYWVYRKCYGGALLLAAGYILGLFAAGELLGSLMLVPLNVIAATAFFPVHHHRAERMLRHVSAANLTPDEALGYAARFGGVNTGAAALVLFVLVLAYAGAFALLCHDVSLFVHVFHPEIEARFMMMGM